MCLHRFHVRLHRQSTQQGSIRTVPVHAGGTLEIIGGSQTPRAERKGSTRPRQKRKILEQTPTSSSYRNQCPHELSFLRQAGSHKEHNVRRRQLAHRHLDPPPTYHGY